MFIILYLLLEAANLITRPGNLATSLNTLENVCNILSFSTKIDLVSNISNLKYPGETTSVVQCFITSIFNIMYSRSWSYCKLYCKMSMNIGLYRIFFNSQQSEILPRRKEISMYNIVYNTLIS